jgi:hypothetical protein
MQEIAKSQIKGDPDAEHCKASVNDHDNGAFCCSGQA